MIRPARIAAFVAVAACASATIASAAPDLTTTITGLSSTYAQNSSGQVQVYVWLTGTALQANTYVDVKVYLSTNDTYDAGDTLLWQSNNATPDFDSDIINGATYQSRSATLTFSASPGTYYVLARVDGTSFHAESNENNNVTAYQVQIQSSAPPGAPTLNSPANGASLSAGNVTFSWTPASGTNRSRIKICTDAVLSQHIAGSPFEPAVGVTSITQSLGAGTFYWQVQGIGVNETAGWGPWSLARSLNVTAAGTPPGAPTLNSPANGASLSAGNVTFSWTPASGTNRSRIKICTDAALSQHIAGSPFEPGVGVTSITQSLGAGTFYWQVQGIGVNEALGWGPWSASRSLTVTAAGTPPGAPTLNSPANGATLAAGNVTFSWTPASGTNRSRIKICTDAALSQHIAGSPFEPAAGVTSITQSLSAGTLYWQVQGIGVNEALGWGPWSASRSLTVTTLAPDLTVSTSYAPGTTYIAGEPVSFQVTVTRSGGPLVAGSYVQVRLFLSADSQYQPNVDTQLWTSNDTDFTVTDLNVNGSRTRTATILVPNQSGSFFLLAVVDRPDGYGPDGFHAESNPNNNTEAKTFAVDRGLWGRVALSSGGPVSNATVALRPVGGAPIRQSVTDSAGVYRLPSSGLAVQDYEVVPAYTGHVFTPAFHRINGLAASGVYPNFDFTGSGADTTAPRAISGTVYALGGAPLSGATVKAFLSGVTPAAQATTLANGSYTLAVFANSYAIHVESAGRFFLARPANATQGNVNLDFYEQTPDAPVVTFDPATAQLFQAEVHLTNQSQTISAEVMVQGNGFPSVILEYRSLGASAWQSVAMTNTGVLWSYALSSNLFVSPGIEVRVVATHSGRTTTTDARQLRVGNRPPSQVTVVGISATDPPILKATGQAHAFEAFVAEPDGDAVSVAVFYKLVGVHDWLSQPMSPTGVPGRFSGAVPGTSIQSGLPTLYYVRAVDSLGAFTDSATLRINRVPPRQGDPRQAQTVADPINAANGNYLYRKAVLPLQAYGRAFSVSLHYNSIAPSPSALGHGWTHDFDTTVAPLDDGSVLVRHADGGADVYVSGSAPDVWICQDRAVRSTLTKDGSGLYTLTEIGGGKTRFTSFGRVSRLEWPDGVALACAWNAMARQLQSVQIQPNGPTYTFSYGSSGLVTAIADSTGRQVGFVHDGPGNLVELVDVEGERTRFEHDSNHRVLQIVLPEGNTLLSNVYDAFGRVVDQRDGKGARWQLAYDTPTPGTTTITDPDGRTRRVVHGGREEWFDLVREDGRQVQVLYGPNGLPSSVTTPDQQTFSLLHDARGNVMSVTEPGGHTSSMTWDASDLLASITEPGNFTTSLVRDGAGRVTQLADAQGSVNYTFAGLTLTNINDRLNGNTQLVHDAVGNVIGYTDPAGVSVSITRDARGNVIGRSDPTRTTTSQVDAHGRPVRIVDSVAGEFAFGYDLNGNLLVFTTPLGTTRYVYDANDQVVEVVDPENSRTAYTRDARAMIVRVRDPLGNEWVLDRDAMGNVVRITSPEGREVSYTYDWAGRVLTRADAAGVATFVRDGRGLVIEVIDPLTKRWFLTRDGRGLVTRVVDPLNRETSYEYDSARRLIAVTDARGRRTSYGHDAHHLRSAGRPSGTGTVQYGYDGAGRALSMTDGMGRTWTNSFTNGRLTSVQRPDGSLMTLTYTPSGRLQSVSAGADTRSFTYGTAGLVETATTSGGTTRTSYNHRGQIVRREDEFGAVVLAAYDAAGRLSALTYEGMTVTYSYDRDGLLTRVADSFNRILEYGYDAAGRLVTTTYPNGVATTITRDAAGRMTGLRHEKGGVSLAAWSIVLDALGNRTRITCTAGAISWDLPNGVHDFSVSPTGQLQAQGPSAFQYDPQGCMTSWPSSTGMRTLTHTSFGRLSTMTGGGVSTSYRYDADGEVIRLMRNGTETRFVQDLTGSMSRIVAERNAANATTARYAWGHVLAWRIETGTNLVRYYHADPIGNIVLLTDEGGAAAVRYAYTPFGEPVGVQGSSTNPFRFGGSLGVLDALDGTLVMRRRVYAPELGRFLSPDPVEQPTSEPQGRNVYTYAINNPWGVTDPTGLTGQRDHGDPGHANPQLPLAYPQPLLRLSQDSWKELQDRRLRRASDALTAIEYAGKSIGPVSEQAVALANRGLDAAYGVKGLLSVDDALPLLGKTISRAAGAIGFALDVVPEWASIPGRLPDDVSLWHAPLIILEVGDRTIAGLGKGLFATVTLPFRWAGASWADSLNDWANDIYDGLTLFPRD